MVELWVRGPDSSEVPFKPFAFIHRHELLGGVGSH